MKQCFRWAAALASALCIVALGCASGPHIEAAAAAIRPEERAHLVVPDTSRHFSQISIQTLNEERVPGRARQMELAPGTHAVSLAYEGRSMCGAHLYGGERRGVWRRSEHMILRFEALRGKRYHVFANRQGRHWTAAVIDTETGERVSTVERP